MAKIYRVLIETVSVFALICVVLPSKGLADKPFADSAKEAGREVKKTGRQVSDDTCEMVNGKTQCAAKKLKHGVQNTTDDVKTKTGH
jgi:hypothetical protein